MLAKIHSILAYDVPRTEGVGLPTKFRLNVGPALQPIAGSMSVNRVRRWPNSNLPSGMLYTSRKHVAFNQCCFNVDLQSTGRSLKQHWMIVLCFLTAALCWWCFNIPAPETPDNTIHRPNADVMLGYRLRRYDNIIPTKTLKAFKHKCNHDNFSEHLLKTKVLNLRTWNVILHMFIKTGVQKCEPLPTHSTLLPPK